MTTQQPDEEQRTWEGHWRDHQVPWDAGASPPALLGLLESGVLSDFLGEESRIDRPRALVPGCGSGYDVFTLAQAGFDAVGLDLAPSLVPHFEGTRDRMRKARDFEASAARLEIADFFHWSSEPVDFVWDYTFYCAIDPPMRSEWKARLLELLRPGGLLGTLIFPVLPNKPRNQGPPFPLDPQEVKSRLLPDFQPIQLLPVVKSHEGREGKEWLGLWRRL